MAPKRKSEPEGAGVGSFFKKTRNDEQSIPSEDELQALTHEELLVVAIGLSKDLATAAQQLRNLQTTKPLQETTGNRQPEPAAWTPERVSERASQMRSLCGNGIKRQMKWQPSCKQGRTKWSYEGVVPNGEVFCRMFSFETASKPFKQKKITVSEFGKLFGDISVSCRYNYLRITGENVNVHWSEEDKVFRVSGTYGI